MSARRPDRVRLYRMPAARLLAALPPGEIDVLVTDPPYTTVDRHGGSGHLRDWFKDGLTWREIGVVLAAARRKMKPTGVAFVMSNGAGLRDALVALERAGFERVRTIAWDRRYPGLGTGLRHQVEFVLVGRLPGSRPLTGVDLVSVAAIGPGTADRYPTEKLEGLGLALAKMAGVGPGQLVVDPFCGSGALLAGALGRGATVVGGDVSARAITRATGRLVGRAARPTPSPTGRSPSLDGRRRAAEPADRNSARASAKIARRPSSRRPAR
jgi:site-specific DNA-methyltransferase (adenine-specific)